MDTPILLPLMTETAAERRRKVLVEAVYHCRVATNVQLQRLTGLKSRSLFNKEIAQFRKDGFLDQPEITKRMYQFEQNRPMVLALGDKG